ncbi:chaperonin 10-like protein [Corynascus similis CBS 632.67]
MGSIPLPREMKALRYNKPEDFEIVTVPLPQLREDDVLVKHIHEGEFIAEFPLIPGHETVGVVAAIGPKVTDFKIGDRVAADVSELCNHCFYCRRGESLLCEKWSGHGINLPGGFAEYCAFPQAKVFKIHNLSDIEATLIEPASCAAHGLDKIRPRLGSSVLAQLLRQNGASHLALAAPAGPKMELAKQLDAADTYIELSRGADAAAQQLEQIKRDNPYGFDIVIEATGSTQILEGAIDFCRRGGTLVVYGVYPNAARVSWPPAKIFGDELRIIGSFSEVHMFPQTVEYLDSGKIKTQGIVNKVFKLEQYGEALESIRNKTAIKAAIVFDD